MRHPIGQGLAARQAGGSSPNPMEEDPLVVRELTAADLGDDVLLDLIRNDDPLGVLTTYVDGGSTAADRRAARTVAPTIANSLHLMRCLLLRSSPSCSSRVCRSRFGVGAAASRTWRVEERDPVHLCMHRHVCESQVRLGPQPSLTLQ
jgi:hypothetical protein